MSWQILNKFFILFLMKYLICKKYQLIYKHKILSANFCIVLNAQRVFLCICNKICRWSRSTRYFALLFMTKNVLLLTLHSNAVVLLLGATEWIWWRIPVKAKVEKPDWHLKINRVHVWVTILSTNRYIFLSCFLWEL